MVDHPPTVPARPISPLRNARATPPTTGEASLIATEYPNLGYLMVRGKASDQSFMDAIASTLQVQLPLAPRSIATCDAGVVVWQSPDEWWLLTSRRDKDTVFQALSVRLRDCFSQLVDNSGGFTSLHVRGQDCLTLLRHLSPYDFESLAIGECASTVIGKASFAVARTHADGATLIFRRSFADYIWALIDRAALPYGLRLTSPDMAADALLSPLLDASKGGASSMRARDTLAITA